MQRIGLLGGTFNPIHIGHLAIAQTACEKLKLDKVIFIPCCLPPQKSGMSLVGPERRLAMVKMAIESNKKFEVSDVEIKRGGRSYSIDTVKYFIEAYPKKTKFFFIIGEDNLATLPSWKSIDDLLGLVTFVVISRAGGANKLTSVIKVKYIPMPTVDVSSSYVRKQMLGGSSVQYLLPLKVMKYIEQQKLYSLEEGH